MASDRRCWISGGGRWRRWWPVAAVAAVAEMAAAKAASTMTEAVAAMVVAAAKTTPASMATSGRPCGAGEYSASRGPALLRDARQGCGPEQTCHLLFASRCPLLFAPHKLHPTALGLGVSLFQWGPRDLTSEPLLAMERRAPSHDSLVC